MQSTCPIEHETYKTLKNQLKNKEFKKQNQVFRQV
jgi:hypothetical protein